MFQTFSGNSRRPRQVNLSGQNTNPFAASSWSPSASGAQKTVAHAQQERQQRQQERERLNASKRIQRVWRGHRSRRQLADLRRQSWDRRNEMETGLQCSLESLAEQVQLLVLFFNSRRQDDLERLVSLGEKISILGINDFVNLEIIQPQLLRFAKITLQALQCILPKHDSNLLRLLVAIIVLYPKILLQISDPYYHLLSMLAIRGFSGESSNTLFEEAVKAPLLQHVQKDQQGEIVQSAYAAFALNFLTTPHLEQLLHGLDTLVAPIDVGLLSTALVKIYTSGSAVEKRPDGRLWLLAHFIALHRFQSSSPQEPDFIRALSLQLSSASADIIGRMTNEDSVTVQNVNDEEDSPQPLPQPPVAPYIKQEISSLVNNSSISSLLEKFKSDYAGSSQSGKGDASLLASYILTLLRIFPQRRDDIRMWLHLGSMNTFSGKEIPPLKFFWHAMRSTSTFAVILGDSKATLSILRPQQQLQSDTSALLTRDREWRTILLFLELYTFVLRFTDDEEFLGSDNSDTSPNSGPTSRIRESALPLKDVEQLTVFLKNLAFTMYYNASELSDVGQHITEGGIGSYFGATVATSRFEAPKNDTSSKQMAQRPFAGIAGMTFDYVRTIVTGAMHMLYQRNSRRRFLPKDHWLMTSRFDMEGFIPAVVLEEERQHQVGDDGEEEEALDDIETIERRGALVGMSRPRRAQQIESLRKQQQKAQRKRLLAAVGPRLEVLQNMPFVIPFETRVQIFRQFVHLDQTRRRGGHVDPDSWRMSMVQNAMVQGLDRNAGREVLGKHHAKIRRERVFDDAYEQFYELGDGLKEPIQITFVDQFEAVEAGIDGGGVTKEFLTSVTNEAFRPGHGACLFTANDQNLLYPNPAALDERAELLRQSGLREYSKDWADSINDLLKRYQFLGRVVGKCMYEGILVDIGFAGFFLLKWAASASTSNQESGYLASINDLRDLDESLYQGLLKLKNYPGNVEDFSLDFTVTDTVSLPGEPVKTITRDLVPNGSSILVNNSNRLSYISCVARHRLQWQPKRQTQAFLKGLGEIINPSWLSMFNQSELQTLIGGDSSGIDIEDLRNNSVYNGVYQIGDDLMEHPTIQLFWEVMHGLEDSDRRKVLKYVTSTPRAPLLGFSQLNPRFTIRDSGADEDRLPSASTCVNLLKLPRYATASKLKAKLLYAVNSGAGFDLS